MSNDNEFPNAANYNALTPDDDVAPLSPERRSFIDAIEPDNFDNAPEEDDGPEALAHLEELEKGDRRAVIPKVRWANDEDHPDFAHLLSAQADGLTTDDTFELTPDVLELLIEANSFKPVGPGNKFVFALRGGMLANGKRQVENATSVSIKDHRPDHRNFRCTIGFYDRANKKITAYLASTVPNVKYMTNYYKKMNRIGRYTNMGSNLLPTGCYVFRKNAHSKGRIKPALRMTDPGNLKNDAVTTVLRTSNDLTYKHADLWDQTMPYDNVHCAYKTSSFSSAGCQTIIGANKSGPWGRFQKELDKQPWDTRFDYLLLTGRDAAIAAKILQSDRDDKDELVKKHLRRLRLGSHGPVVAALQIKMGFTGKTQYFGPSTRTRLVEFERKQGTINSDSIYSAADDKAFAWKVFDAPDAQTPTIPPPATPPGTTAPGTTPPTTSPGLVADSLVILSGAPGTQPSLDMKSLIVPGEGTWTVGPIPGKITFTPETGFHGKPHPIIYRISNTAGNTQKATISVTVLDTNKGPVVVDDTVTTIEGKPVHIAVLANDSDTDGTIVPTSVRLVSVVASSAPTADGKTLSVPNKGTWIVDAATGDVAFSPASGFIGTTQTKYQVADEDGATGTGTISVTVTPAPSTPVTQDDSAETTAGTPVTIDVLANDTAGIPTPPVQPPVQPPVTPQPPGDTTGPDTPTTPPQPPVTQPPGTGLPVTGVITMSESQLRRFAPKAKDKYINALVIHGTRALAEYGINANAMRLGHFLAQIGHESGGFTIDRESLYYTSAKRIRQVWPSRFKTLSYASQFTRNEEKLAGEVYDGRLRDLGNTQRGDGFKYRGRGLIQITGRGNYKDMGKKIGVDLEGDPDLATDGLTALKIAARTWYDRTRSGRTMNQLADDNKIDVITKRINGGHTNLGQRKSEFQRAWAIWGNGPTPHAVKNPNIIERGQKGERVKSLQRLLVKKGYFPVGEKIDGIFGGNTQKVVMRFQHTHNQSSAGIDQLNVNGIVGTKTMQALQAAPDAERRAAPTPARSARDPRSLGQPPRRADRPRRDHYAPETPAADTCTSYLRLAAVFLTVAAIGLLCVAAASEHAHITDTHALWAEPMMRYIMPSIAMIIAAVGVFGFSAWRLRKPQPQPYPDPEFDPATEYGNFDEPFEPEPEGTPPYQRERDARNLDTSPAPAPAQVVRGLDTPFAELGIDEKSFEDPEPVRYAPGLPEDVDTLRESLPEEEPLPELVPESNLEVPGGPPKRDIMGNSTRAEPLPFEQVTDRDVPLVLIKMFGGDNNLSHQVENDLQEIAAGIRASNGTVAMLALADLQDAPASIIEINRNGVRKTVSHLGEIDTGDPETLAHFLSRALKTYPNSRKAIGFWDHGTGSFDEADKDEKLLTRSHRSLSGRSRPARRLFIPESQRESLNSSATTRGMLHDNTGGLLTNVEAGRMLAAAYHRAGQDEPIDLLYSDTCLNGMIEVLEELGEFAHCVVASSDTEPGAGWDYEQWITTTTHEFPATPQAWGRSAVHAFTTRYRDATHEHPCTLAAFESANDITEAFAQLVTAAKDAGWPGWLLLNQIRSRSQPYDNRDSYDLLDFAGLLAEIARNGTDQTELANAAVELDRACRTARVEFTAMGRRVTGSQGLAFWFPSNRRSMEDDIKTYRHLKFAQTTGWAEYLEENYTGTIF